MKFSSLCKKKNLILGTVNFGIRYGIDKIILKEKEVNKVLSLALKNNISLLDTAQSYGDSETRIGKYKKAKFKVISKINFQKKHCNYLELKKTVNRSLKKLKTHNLEAILFHDTRILFSKNGKKIFENLLKLKKDNLFKKIGVSIYDFKQIKFLTQNYKINIVQCPFNIIDQRLLEGRWFQYLKKKRIEIHVRSVFLQGVLLKNKYNSRKYFKEISYLIENWRLFLKKNKISPIEGALSYIFQKNIKNVIIGVENTKELKNILESRYIKNFIYKFEKNKLAERFYNPSLWKIK